MRKSVIASVSLHALLLGAALFVMASPEAFDVPPQDSIPIDIVSIEDFSKRQAMAKSDDKKKVEKPKSQKQETVKDVKPEKKIAPEEKKTAEVPTVEEEPVKEAEKPVEKPPEKVVEKPPEKKVEDPPPPDQTALEDVLKKTEDEVALAEKLAAEEKALEAEKKAAEEKKVAEARKAEEKQKKSDEKKKAEAEKKKKEAEEKKVADAEAAKKAKKAKEFNPDEISELLDKDSDEATAPQKPTEETGEPIQDVANLQGDDDAIAATIVDMLRKKLSDCWEIPPGAREADITVKVKFRLDQAGNLVGEPVVMGGSSDPLFEVTARSVVSAVARCQSYDFLPAEQYDLWKENTMRFNPNKMNPA